MRIVCFCCSLLLQNSVHFRLKINFFVFVDARLTTTYSLDNQAQFIHCSVDVFNEDFDVERIPV